MTDAQGHTTSYGIDADTGLTQWVRQYGESEAERTEYTYDAVHHLTSIRRNLGNEIIETSYEYDQDRIEGLESPSETRYNLEYGVFDQLNRILIGNRILAEYTYSDDQNRYLLQTDYGNGDYRTFGYDTYGRLIQIGYEDLECAAEYQYNNEGHLGRQIDYLTGRITQFLYDLSGRRAGYEVIGTGFNQKVTYEYDDLNNVTEIAENLNGLSFVNHFIYDRDNRVTESETRRAGSQISKNIYTYDGLNRLNGSLLQRNNLNLLETQITYRNIGSDRTTSTIEYWTNIFSGTAENYHYTYDEKDNIHSITDPSGIVTYEYDNQNRLIRENNAAAGKTWIYEYDLGGNVLSKKEYSFTTGNPGVAQKTTNYEYHDENWPDLLTGIRSGSETRSLVSDSIGNPLDDGVWNYEWIHGRQLSRVYKPGTDILYHYDIDGNRTEKIVNGVITSYSYLNGKLSEMRQGNNVLHFYYDVWGTNGFTLNTTRYYYLRNMQGDIVGIINGNGSKVVSYRYDAWGNLLNISGSMAGTLGVLNPLRYRGYVYDNETGFYNLKSRYYYPEIGRFINVDEVGSWTFETGGFIEKNLFAYCDSNPVVRTDTEGRFWETIIDVISLGASIVEVCVNPYDPWAWAGFAGDFFDVMIPFVSGVGEATRGIKTTVKVVDNADDVVDAAKVLYKTADKTSDIRTATGSYEIVFKSGKNYVGKGGFERVIQSAQRYGDDVATSIMWKSAPNAKEAFIDEFMLQLKRGVLSSNPYAETYNKIWSPGKRLYNECK